LETVLSISNLTKHFGRIKAVNSLNLEVHRGQVFGMLGPNGSGKTTTLGMLMGVVNPTAGHFSWFGDPPSHHIRKKIGAVLEHPIFSVSERPKESGTECNGQGMFSGKYPQRSRTC
jgi:ABC-type multidrug transport system ATPase subunit